MFIQCNIGLWPNQYTYIIYKIIQVNPNDNIKKENKMSYKQSFTHCQI